MGSTPWKNDKWYTSFWNFDERAKAMYNFADEIKFHDVTLRDGEQQSGLVFNKDQKVAIAEKLAEVGIQRIEAGMPVVSAQDAQAIEEIAKRKKHLNMEVFTFARCMSSDAQLAYDLGADGIVMEIPASENLIKYGYRWETPKAIEAAIKSTKFAHELGLYVTLFMIDFSRADWNYLTNFVDQVNQYGYFDALACVDTYGVLNPLGAYYMTKEIKARYPGKKIEIHAHDDFGMGSQATIMALAAGADVAHTTIAAIGERAGNTSYEEVAFDLLTTYGKDTGLDISKMYSTAHFLYDMAGITCRPNRGIIGPDISKMESGLVIGWYENLKNVNPLILFPYLFPITGHPDITYTIGKHSGAPTVRYYLNQMGIKDASDEIGRAHV
jgi:isopropylmalate/homocitrate/citramalate synthase